MAFEETPMNSSNPIITTIASKSLNLSLTYFFIPNPKILMIISSAKKHVKTKFPIDKISFNYYGIS